MAWDGGVENESVEGLDQPETAESPVVDLLIHRDTLHKSRVDTLDLIGSPLAK